jgi:hypothetical protein
VCPFFTHEAKYRESNEWLSPRNRVLVIQEFVDSVILPEPSTIWTLERLVQKENRTPLFVPADFEFSSQF